MAEAVSDRLSSVECDVREVFCFSQPALSVHVADGVARVTGTYFLRASEDSVRHGPLAEYEIKLDVHPDYPEVEPRLFETGGKIPEERHLNPDGTCCTGVWEEWLAETQDRSFKAYCDGPLRDYFLSQRHFELTGEWPFGEREHGLLGVFNGCASVLGLDPDDPRKVFDHLRFLQQPNVKGHWPCPCGSGQIIRKCHGQAIFDMMRKVPPGMAGRMLDRMRSLVR